MKQTVFLNLNKIRYKWEEIEEEKIQITSSRIKTPDLSIGLLSDDLFLEMKIPIKVLFFDLGNTLVHRPDEEEKFVAYPETNTILSNLKSKGVEVAIISDGDRSQLETLLADTTLLDKFRLVVMSDDADVGGITKPRAKIFNIAIAKMSRILGIDLVPSETAFLTETTDHFKAYNFLYTMGLRSIIANDCGEYVDH